MAKGPAIIRVCVAVVAAAILVSQWAAHCARLLGHAFAGLCSRGWLGWELRYAFIYPSSSDCPCQYKEYLEESGGPKKAIADYPLFI